MKKWTRILSLVLVAFMLAGVCTFASAEGTIKDEVVVVLKGEPSNIDPHNNSELVAMTTQIQIYDTLVTKDHDGNIIPCLAESWEVIDDHTVRFHLRNDVYFHNGDKLTAEDVAFSIARATVKPTSAAHFAAFDGENCKAIDELTVDIATKYPYAAMYNYLASTRGQILCKRAMEEMGEDAYGRNPIGTGAFVFDNWVTGTSITLKRNENYWGKKPAYSTLTLKFITEVANRSLEIEAGNADIGLDPDANDLNRLKTVEGIQVVSDASYGYSYIAFTMTDPIVGSDADPRIRQALSMALDLDTLVYATYGDYAKPCESVLPINVFSWKSQGKHVYDVEGAKKLLADAGYPNGLDLRLNLSDSNEHQMIGIIAQNMWKEIGVNAAITTTSLNEMLASGRRGENQIAVTAANFTTGDPGHALADFDPTSDGWFRPNDAKIKEYLNAGAAEFDVEKRAAIYQEAQEYIYNKYYIIPVADKNVNYLITDKVENFWCNPGNTPSFVDVIVYE